MSGHDRESGFWLHVGLSIMHTIGPHWIPEAKSRPNKSLTKINRSFIVVMVIYTLIYTIFKKEVFYEKVSTQTTFKFKQKPL
ncbi:hypothetical protein KDA_65550 [Dictyobacter alpinus]|uniref:Uncharacterized protein n=1 Tax=Dictyobacter alpinus TaxID=2014873 RepID=A0A402BI21_9CHLR|nr:hypothetical protein KDA_65550 [Dictyobacter alpinus]